MVVIVDISAFLRAKYAWIGCIFILLCTFVYVLSKQHRAMQFDCYILTNEENFQIALWVHTAVRELFVYEKNVYLRFRISCNKFDINFSIAKHSFIAGCDTYLEHHMNAPQNITSLT